jgi:hypothetical protein
MLFEDKPIEIGGRDEWLFWSLLELMGALGENGKTLWQQQGWWVAVFLEDCRPEPLWRHVSFKGDGVSLYRTFGAKHGQVNTAYNPKNALRALAAASRKYFRTFGHTLCHCCRKRKTLKWFAFDKCVFVWSCRWCFESLDLPPKTTRPEIVRSRVELAVLETKCRGHPICGACYIRHGFADLRTESIEQGLRHNPILQRFASGVLDVDDERRINMDIDRGGRDEESSGSVGSSNDPPPRNAPRLSPLVRPTGFGGGSFSWEPFEHLW